MRDALKPGAQEAKSSIMSMSSGGLRTSPALRSSVAKKIKRAVTDNDDEVRFDPEAKPGVSNLLSILAACTGRTPAECAEGYTQYGPLKTDTAAAVVEEVACAWLVELLGLPRTTLQSKLRAPKTPSDEEDK